MLNFKSVTDNIRCKMLVRRKIGFFDHHPASFDQRMAKARAWRVCQRVNNGVRITLNQALWG